MKPVTTAHYSHENLTTTHNHLLHASNNTGTPRKISKQPTTKPRTHQNIQDDPLPSTKISQQSTIPTATIKTFTTSHYHPLNLPKHTQRQTTTIKFSTTTHYHQEKSHSDTQPPTATSKQPTMSHYQQMQPLNHPQRATVLSRKISHRPTSTHYNHLTIHNDIPPVRKISQEPITTH